MNRKQPAKAGWAKRGAIMRLTALADNRAAVGVIPVILEDARLLAALVHPIT